MSAFCTICKKSFKEDDNVWLTSCGHVYHLQCIQRWRKRNPYLNFSSHLSNNRNQQFCKICLNIFALRNSKIFIICHNLFMIKILCFRGGKCPLCKTSFRSLNKIFLSFTKEKECSNCSMYNKALVSIKKAIELAELKWKKSPNVRKDVPSQIKQTVFDKIWYTYC